jgi:hypothetical protein
LRIRGGILREHCDPHAWRSTPLLTHYWNKGSAGLHQGIDDVGGDQAFEVEQEIVADLPKEGDEADEPAEGRDRPGSFRELNFG